MEVEMKTPLSPPFSIHVPLNETEPHGPESPPAPISALAPVKRGLKNSWPMHAALPWPRQLDLGAGCGEGFESH